MGVRRMRNNGFLLFDTVTGIDPLNGRPTGTQITNWTIGIAKGFSNMGTSTQAIAGIPLTSLTDKIKIPITKYRLQRNLLAQDIRGEWKLWTVLKPEDVVPRNPNLTNLALQELINASILSLARSFYDKHKGGA